MIRGLRRPTAASLVRAGWEGMCIEVISKKSFGLPPWRDWALGSNPRNTGVILRFATLH
jgi:hypothetical protein